MEKYGVLTTLFLVLSLRLSFLLFLCAYVSRTCAYFSLTSLAEDEWLCVIAASVIGYLNILASGQVTVTTGTFLFSAALLVLITSINLRQSEEWQLARILTYEVVSFTYLVRFWHSSVSFWLTVPFIALSLLATYVRIIGGIARMFRAVKAPHDDD